MCRLIRLVAVWALALALPVQGIAAASMLHCKALSSESASSSHHASAQHGAAHHEGGHQDSSPHNASPHDASPHAAATHDTAHDVARAPEGGHHGSVEGAVASAVGTHGAASLTCSVCAACLFASAMPQVDVTVPAPLASYATPVAPAPRHVGFFTDVLERPPKA